jgi:hypothetical protein
MPWALVAVDPRCSVNGVRAPILGDKSDISDRKDLLDANEAAWTFTPASAITSVSNRLPPMPGGPLDDQHAPAPLHQRRHQRANHLQLARPPRLTDKGGVRTLFGEAFEYQQTVPFFALFMATLRYLPAAIAG